MNSAEQTVKLNLGHKRHCRERIGNTVVVIAASREQHFLPKMKAEARRPPLSF
jgi:hypothetical protein